MASRSVLVLSFCLILSACAVPRGGFPLGLAMFGTGVAIGSIFTDLPHRHARIDDHIYYADGVYYRDTPRGYVVVNPRPGLWVDELPRDYKVIRRHQRDYYTSKGVWYRFDPDRDQYRVIAEPLENGET